MASIAMGMPKTPLLRKFMTQLSNAKVQIINVAAPDPSSFQQPLMIADNLLNQQARQQAPSSSSSTTNRSGGQNHQRLFFQQPMSGQARQQAFLQQRSRSQLDSNNTEFMFLNQHFERNERRFSMWL